MQPDVTLAILAFIAFAIPVVGAMWRLFAVRESLQSAIIENRHRVALLEQKNDFLLDQQEAFLNGIQERLQHVRDRSLHAEKALEMRIDDLEGFIEKTTSYQRRTRKV